MADKESSRKYAWLEDVHRSRHTPKTKNVAWAIFYFANSKTLHCWPNYDTLDEVLGGRGNGKNIGDHIKALEKSGHLKIGKQPGEKFRSNGYWLTFPDPASGAEGDGSEQEPPTGPSESHGAEGVTLSRTLSDNSFTNSFNEKPSASEIQEEIRKMGDAFFSSGSVSSPDSVNRQYAASPHVAAIEEPAPLEVDEIPNEEW